MAAIIKKLWIFLVPVLFLIGLSSCDKDEPSMPDDPPEQNDPSEKDNPGEKEELTKSELKSLVNKYVTIHVSYHDYYWHFKIISDLKLHLDNSKIRYAIGLGVRSNGEEDLMFTEHLEHNDGTSVKIDSYYTNDIIKIEVPFWYYFVWGVDNPDEETFVLLSMYYSSWKALMQKDNLTSEEAEVLNSLMKRLGQAEYEMKKYFRPSVRIYYGDVGIVAGRYNIVL